MVASLSAGIAGSAIRESLWLDEIHTSWVLWGSENTLVERAAQGNQTPLYFYLLRPIYRTLGISEVSLRAPSVLAFSLSLGICTYLLLKAAHITTGGRLSTAALMITSVVVWALLDRIELFFATEARAYAICQLLLLIGWWLVLMIAWQTAESARDGNKTPLVSCSVYLVVWSVVTIVSINLHLISGLASAWQWLTITGVLVLALFRQFRVRNLLLVWSLLTVLMALAVAIPNFETAELVWGRRRQWESFGGDASWSKLASLFAFTPILVPTLVGLVFARFVHLSLRRSDAKPAQPVEKSWASREYAWIWLVAVLGPLATAWALTAMEITPILHRRYLLCIALPLVMFCAHALLAIRFKALQWSVLIASFYLLATSQGSFEIWSKGQLVGAQRPEDWRSAAIWVNRRIDESMRDVDNARSGIDLLPKVWIASGLIEASEVRYPLSESDNAYLSFPLRGLYRVGTSDGQVLLPHALIGGWPDWTRVIAADATKSQNVFVLFRGDLRAFQSAVEKMADSSSLEVVAPTRAFGSVCVAYLRDLQ